MILDDLGLLRGDGSNGHIEDTEAGVVDATDRAAVTGQIVLDIKKTGKNGIPVVVITDTEEAGDRDFQVTIEADDDLNFGTAEVVATFPEFAPDDTESKLMVRRIHTDKRYIRSVITRTTTGTDGWVDALIFVGHQLMNQDA